MLLEEKSLSTAFGRSATNKTPILTTDQSADTNHTSMEHLSLSTIIIGSKYIVISSEWLGNKLIVSANQESTPIDIRGHGDREFPFGIQKSGNKMSVDFGRNADDKIGMNPSRTIRIPRPQITSTRKGSCDIFDLVSRTSDLSYMGFLWYGTDKIESKNLGGNTNFENAESENNFEAENVGHKNSVVWNHKDSDSIHVDPNHTYLNQPIPEDLINIRSIHHSTDICAIEKILISLVNLVHTPSPVPAPPILFLWDRK